MSDEVQVTELEALKARANQIGLKFHPSIGVEALRNKVNAALAGETVDEDEEEDDLAETPAANASIPKPTVTEPAKPRALTANELRVQKYNEARKLVRVRITCMNPMKKEWQGEQFSVANRSISINRFVPFEVEWHIENLLLQTLRDRQYLAFVSKRVGPQQIEVKEHRMIREFAIEVLDPLTPAELKDLAQRQAMAAGTQE
jgi:hypothetical protein